MRHRRNQYDSILQQHNRDWKKVKEMGRIFFENLLKEYSIINHSSILDVVTILIMAKEKWTNDNTER